MRNDRGAITKVAIFTESSVPLDFSSPREKNVDILLTCSKAAPERAMLTTSRGGFTVGAKLVSCLGEVPREGARSKNGWGVGRNVLGWVHCHSSVLGV